MQLCHIYLPFYNAIVVVLCNISGVQWENKCSYVSATVGEFHDWQTDNCQSDNPLITYECNRHWCYADYKHMIKLFATEPDILKVFLFTGTFLKMLESVEIEVL